MLRYLLDTDSLTLFRHGHAVVVRHLTLHTGEVAISVVSIEETLRGRLAKLARASDGPTRIREYAVLAKTIQFFTQVPIVAYDQPAEHRFQQLRSLRVGTQDLKIASIALENQLIPVTRNRRDFARVPGLVLEDWSL
jgi:tRNA(fMet)-specific endonuclease VapC